jgi:hypothetical protein
MAVTKPATSPESEGTFLMRASRSPSRFDVKADDDHAVGNAGLVLTAIVAERLGIETPGGSASRPGR